MNICEKLKSSYNDGMTLEQLIDAFENSFMNADSEEYPELMFLFETGIFNFTGEKMFYFTLTGQYEGYEDEYFQIHMDILYPPDDNNKNYKVCEWVEDNISCFTKFVKDSPVFAHMKNTDISSVQIYEDET